MPKADVPAILADRLCVFSLTFFFSRDPTTFFSLTIFRFLSAALKAALLP